MTDENPTTPPSTDANLPPQPPHHEQARYEPERDWPQFLRQRCKKQLGILGKEFPHVHSLYIDYKDVAKWGAKGGLMADNILDQPGAVIEDIQTAITNNNLIITAKPNTNLSSLNIRFIKVGRKVKIRDLRAEDVGKCISTDIITVRASEVKPRLVDAIFKCPAGHFTRKRQTIGRMIEPDGCATDGCAYKKLELVPKRSTMTNQQKLNVQEHGEDLRPGQQPQAIDVIALDDECDKLYPGDRATLNCIVRMQQRVVKGEKTTVFDIYLDLSSVEIEQSDFEEVTINEEAEEKIKEIAQSGQALEIIAASIAPSIYGYTEIKKGAALQMFGGVTSTNSDGSQNRGEIHIAVLGDPGVAKSRLIKYIARQSPRGVFVSSVTSSGVGLTGAATRDEDGRWIIEAGALPLADKGVGAIDEIDKADPDTIDSLLNIMEDGEVRIAKAGQNRLLKARCSIIVAGNPKEERFDTYAAGGLADQINLPPAFLSRFDLIYLMVDQPDAALDAERSKHVIKTRYIGECKEAGKPDKLSAEEKADTEPAIPTILLKQYIAYAKRKIFPIMNEATRTYLTKHYVEVRSKQGGVQQGSAANTSIAPPTMRQQEALVRMAEASARMRLSPEVTLKDAERAVALFDQCLKDVATDPVTGKVDMGRIGQGMAGGKLKLIHAIKDIIRAEDGGGLGGVSVELIISKLDEKGFKGEHEVEKLIEELHKKGDLMQPKSSVQKYKLM